MKRWPNLFIIGAMKAGTTSLYEYLKDIPDIYMSPVKEPKYFSEERDSENTGVKRIKDETEYLTLFEKAKDEKFLGEASPDYLFDPDSAKLINQIMPEAKIIIILRDPIERAFSHYLLDLRSNPTESQVHEKLLHDMNEKIKKKKIRLRLEASFYHDDVKRYLEIFPREQVKILIFEEMMKNPKGTIQEILDFLGLNYELEELKGEAHNPFVGLSVPRGAFSKNFLEKGSKSKFVKKIIPSSIRNFLQTKVLSKQLSKPKLKEEDRKLLKNLYAKDVEKLKNLLERTLPWTNFQNLQPNFGN